MFLIAVFPVTITNNKVKVIGYAEGVNINFVGTCVGTFTINLESGLARKVRMVTELFTVASYPS